MYYTDDLASVREDMLQGFFVGWPRRPSAGQHLAVLRGSYRSVVAIDDADDRVAGFVNILSDGVLTAFIPWLEVLPGYQGQGIGGELMRRILDGTDRFYSVDLVCDAPLVPYYERSACTAPPARCCAIRRRWTAVPSPVRDPDPEIRPRWRGPRCGGAVRRRRGCCAR